MIVLISNPVLQTYIFSGILLVALVLSFRKRQDQDFFPLSVSQELKGLAILTIIFAHVAYALVSDSRFLNPLSTLAGVGVNLFLLLSGYGLIASSIKKSLSIKDFYKRRLLKLYVPFWICLILFFAADHFFLKLDYGLAYTVRAFLGLFWHADLYVDVNAPFWYLSWIVMYYLLFPWLLIKKAPWLSAILMYLVTFAFISYQPHFLDQVIHLYRVHLIAFPLGMLMGWFFNDSKYWRRIKNWFNRQFPASQPVKKNLFNIGLGIILIAAILYLIKNSGVGQQPIVEEAFSIITTLLLVALFLVKKFEIKTLYWFGFFSYEIYMFHWPLMYRYDFLYKYLPAWLALSLYLVIFLGLGWLLKIAVAKLDRITAKPARLKND